MKRNITMNIVKKIGFGVIVIALALACEQPFKSGLGPIVDTRPPTVRLDSPGAGEYIFGGNRTFTGFAEDDYKLDSVWIRITSSPNVKNSDDEDYLREYTRVNLNSNGTWNWPVDTTKFADGELKVQVRALDAAGKTAETDEILFNIKNAPPAISVSMPVVDRGQSNETGKLGGVNLNFGVIDTLPASAYDRRIDRDVSVIGTIRDDRGIYRGTEANGKFPPQIRLWEVGASGYQPGVWPSETEKPWVPLTFGGGPLFELESGNYMFTYELPSDAGKYYGFEIRAQSEDGTEFYYPRDSWANWDELAANPDFEKENRYVLFYINPDEQVPPTVELWGLEDLDNWDNGAYGMLDIDDTRAHPYVHKLSVTKNGDFTLRVKASHPEGISAATMEWDPPVSVTWTSSDNDPNLPGTRTFIFTYDHNSGTLSEGTYRITVSAASSGGTLADAPLLCFVQLDFGPPAVEIQNLTDDAVVNGVITPRFRFEDSRSQDSGLRRAIEPYFQNPASSAFGFEQRYILVSEADKTALDGLIANNWWPPVPAAATDDLDIPGITALKHGPIFGGTCTFKTSPVNTEITSEADYDSALADELDALPDGEYYLYVFARDNAFNVGHTSIKLEVDHRSDFPVFDFSAGLFTDKVTDPNQAADGTENGFVDTNGAVRNRLGTTTTINFRIRDDDSLDIDAVKISIAGSTLVNGTIVAGERFPLSNAAIRQVFSYEPNGRRITEQAGIITQRMLLDALTPGSSAVSLPDGIYEITIEIADDPAFKLGMSGDDPQKATASTSFWVVVDTIRPEISDVMPRSGGYMSSTGVTIEGIVSDQNGPFDPDFIKNSIRLTGDAGTADPDFDAAVNVGDIRRGNSTSTAQWECAFEIPIINMNLPSGRYVITFSIADRFGNSQMAELKYNLDEEPPSVGMRQNIETFVRDIPGITDSVTIPAVSSSDPVANKDRLSNGTLAFRVIATDNFEVTEVRWWLLKANISAVEGSTLNAEEPLWGQVASFNAYPRGAAAYDETTIRYGEIRGDFGAVQYIDAAGLFGPKLEDGEYRLHVLARDSAGNINELDTRHQQTIYILDDQDKPWFGSMTPSSLMVIGDSESRLTVSGMVFEDDGFVIAGGEILPDSIKIAMSNDGTTWTPEQIAPVGNFAASGKNLNIAIPLRSIPLFRDTIFNTDGHKYYRITATDSYFNKPVLHNGAWVLAQDPSVTNKDDYRVSRTSDVFSFIYDTLPPEIHGLSFDKDFTLSGYMEDANLSLTEDGKYYFDYYLEGEQPERFILDGELSGITVNIPAEPGHNGLRITFEITADRFYNTLTLQSGSNTLIFMVYDDSGKTGDRRYDFIMDIDPPDFSFTSIDAERLPHDWWESSYEAKRAWAGYYSIPIIQYQRGGTPPMLIGTFDDDISDIDIASFSYGLKGDPVDTYNAGRAVFTGSGKSVRWTVYLTDTGRHDGTPLPDGIYSIRFTVADERENAIDYEDEDGDPIFYGFRISSAPPSVDLTGFTPNAVYGDKAGTLFTISGKAWGANLQNAELRLRQGNTMSPVLSLGTSGDWDFTGNAAGDMEELTWTNLAITRAMVNSAVGKVDTDPMTSGIYELVLTPVGVDIDLEAEPRTWTFTIDTVKPEFAVVDMTPESRDDLSPGGVAPGVTPVVFRSATAPIQGTISDTHSNLTSVQWRIERFDYAAASNPWTQLQDWTEILAPGERLQEKTWLQPVGAATGLTDGFYRIRLRAKDSAIIDDTAFNWTTGNDGNADYSDYYYFFYAVNAPVLDLDDTSNRNFSSRVSNGKLAFAGTATSNNSFDKLVVSVSFGGVERSEQTIPWPEASYGDTWDWAAEIDFPTSWSDGNYKISFTITDLAGGKQTRDRTITLDNTLPTGRVEWPRQEQVIFGGEDFEISGVTEDTGVSGSASGVAGIWYHLGYLGAIGDVGASIPSQTQVINAALGSGTDAGGTANNDAFDAAAERNDNNWFKYAYATSGTAGGLLPPGFADIPANPDLLSWTLATVATPARDGGLVYYTKPGAVLKTGGTSYNNGGGVWITQKVTDGPMDGLYNLPLWIRVVDTVGNVNYFSHDIWIYPNGDIPSTVFINPQNNTPQTEARGGVVSVDGMASDNRSVKEVLYRVKVDNTQSTAPGWQVTAPIDDQIIIVPGLTPVASGDPEYGKLPSDYQTTGWYRANFETGLAATRPWNFMINAHSEINAVIEEWGFNDMIRVWVEVFVLDGMLASGNGGDFNRISIGASDDPENPLPNIRVFYLKDSAPAISERAINTDIDSISGVDGVDGVVGGTFAPYASSTLLNGKFAIKAKLDGAGSPITQIAMQLRNETENTGWQQVYVRGNAAVTPPTGLHLKALDGSLATSFTAAEMVYAFDPAIPSAANGFAAVRDGEWRHLGGRYTIAIRIRDNVDPPGQAEYIFEVNIDNFAPVADQEKIRTRGKVAGSNETFMGRVFDYQGNLNIRPGLENASQPINRNIKTVYAWFTQHSSGNSGYINMNAKDTPALSVSTLAMTAMEGRTTSSLYEAGSERAGTIVIGSQGIPETRTYPNPGSGLVGNEYVKIINESNAAKQENRMMWQSNSGNNEDITWSFEADTTNMPDGLIYLNYLVIDTAGNASYYQQDIVVMNNYPKIDRISLRTSNVGEGAAFSGFEDDESVSRQYEVSTNASGYLNTNFIVKNMALGFGVETSFGNGDLHYRVQHVARQRIQLNRANLDDMAAKWPPDSENPGKPKYLNLYTIETNSGMNDAQWTALGAVLGNAVGTHFVFQADEDTVAQLTESGFLNSYVWAYTLLGENLSQEWLNSGNTIYDDDDHLRFDGNTYFGDGPGFINETEAGQTAFFLIKVWDSVDTRPTSTEDDMLYDAVVVGMQIFLHDQTAPVITLHPLNPDTIMDVVRNNIDPADRLLTRDNAADPINIDFNRTRGGLFNVGTERNPIKSGYIDVPASGNDKVSGKVILRGRVADNQLIDTISIQIGSNPVKTILELEDGIMVPSDGVLAYVTETLHWQTGHIVEWAYVWDTEEEPSSAGVPVTGLNIIVRANDRKNNASNFTKTVDIVPYITGFERETPRFVTRRSRQGWYSFYQGEQNITVLGYNFGAGGSGNAVTMNLFDDTDSFDLAPAHKPNTNAAYSKNLFTFSIPADAKSGRINMSVGSIPVYNHTSDHTNVWNTEASDYISGSELWVNKPYAHIWRSENSSDLPATYFAGSTSLQRPSMSLQYLADGDTGSADRVGRLHGAWAVYGTEGTYYGQNNAGARIDLAAGDAEPFVDPAIDYFNSANAVAANVGIAHVYQIDGQARLGINIRLGTGWATAPGDNSAVNFFTTIGTGLNPSSTDRWQSVRVSMAAPNTSTNASVARRMYVSAYDSVRRSLWFGARVSGSDTAAATATSTPVMLLDGLNGVAINTALDVGDHNYAAPTSGRAGRYTAIDYITLSTGVNRPIIAYYDEANDTVRLVYNHQGDLSLTDANTTQNTTLTTATNWTRRYVFKPTDDFYRGSGTYVSMVVDRNDGVTVHLAFFNRISNSLVYATGRYDGDFTAYTVDNVVSGGTWTDISLDSGANPWIVYADTSRTGNRDGARIAYRDAAAFTRTMNDADGNPITDLAHLTGWEAITMPANYVVNDDRLNIAAWPPRIPAAHTLGTRPTGDLHSWDAAVGYGSDMFRLAYFFKPAAGIMSGW
ncbi:MAG: Ig-like domain repeat protein [Treponema sp.]|nr:Ig-like domain repeat protein [Treponema sp.]